MTRTMQEIRAQETPHVLARLLDDDNLADPHPYLAWVREHYPVHRSPAGYYLVTRHADCLRSLRVEFFRGPERDQVAELFPLAVSYRTLRLLAGTIIMHNPPEHARLRRLVSRDFGARRVNDLRASTARICDRLLDAVAEPLYDGEVVDLHRSVSAVLPVQVIAELMGVPETDRGWLFQHVPAVLAALAPGASEDLLSRADEASGQVEDYFSELIALRRRQPRDDLMSAWIQIYDDDDGRLSHDELMSMLWGMVAGGLATTAAGLSSGVLPILRHPELTTWLRGDEHQIKAFADEVVRHESPSMVSGVPRYAVRDIELGGVTIPANSEVRHMLASANRDASVFSDPDRFDPSRDTSKTLTFGYGIHYCLGANLARMQLTTALPTLHRRFPGLVLAEQPRWRRMLPVRSIEYLPVMLDTGR